MMKGKNKKEQVLSELSAGQHLASAPHLESLVAPQPVQHETITIKKRYPFLQSLFRFFIHVDFNDHG